MTRLLIMTHLIVLIFWLVIAAFMPTLAGLVAVATCWLMSVVLIWIVNKAYQEKFR